MARQKIDNLVNVIGQAASLEEIKLDLIRGDFRSYLRHPSNINIDDLLKHYAYAPTEGLLTNHNSQQKDAIRFWNKKGSAQLVQSFISAINRSLSTSGMVALRVNIFQAFGEKERIPLEQFLVWSGMSGIKGRFSWGEERSLTFLIRPNAKSSLKSTLDRQSRYLKADDAMVILLNLAFVRLQDITKRALAKKQRPSVQALIADYNEIVREIYESLEFFRVDEDKVIQHLQKQKEKASNHETMKKLIFFDKVATNWADEFKNIFAPFEYTGNLFGVDAVCSWFGDQKLKEAYILAQWERAFGPQNPLEVKITVDEVTIYGPIIYAGDAFAARPLPHESKTTLQRVCILTFPDLISTSQKVREATAKGLLLLDKAKAILSLVEMYKAQNVPKKEIQELKAQFDLGLSSLRDLVDEKFNFRYDYLEVLSRSWQNNPQSKKVVAYQTLEKGPFQELYFIPPHGYGAFLAALYKAHKEIKATAGNYTLWQRNQFINNNFHVLEQRLDDALMDFNSGERAAYHPLKIWGRHSLAIQFRLLDSIELCNGYLSFALPRMIRQILTHFKENKSMEYDGPKENIVESISRFIDFATKKIMTRCPLVKNIKKLRSDLKKLKELIETNIEIIPTDKNRPDRVENLKTMVSFKDFVRERDQVEVGAISVRKNVQSGFFYSTSDPVDTTPGFSMFTTVGPDPRKSVEELSSVSYQASRVRNLVFENSTTCTLKNGEEMDHWIFEIHYSGASESMALNKQYHISLPKHGKYSNGYNYEPEITHHYTNHLGKIFQFSCSPFQDGPTGAFFRSLVTTIEGQPIRYVSDIIIQLP